ncbi:hypothetical protein Nepgr_004783 [Nepenthes gracilis]|uniref:Translation initiation factor 3 N-terminal domain-containing protein n=1 Tax=Nepenthes gracilis TaxID=150966 RepID=A0AAD3S249_NEPGR|nr:hypothetical protein Nepgr_004783 [Nepenthes gracilis]
MAVLFRIKQVMLNHFPHQFRRCYFQIPRPCLANYISSYQISGNANNIPTQVIHRRPTEFFDNVRLFAAPVQAKKKEEENDTSGPRINEQITADFVRLVTDEGHGVVSRRQAMDRAKSLKLDLVEVQRNAKPPVCKIMDYHRERYKQQVKEKDKTKNKSEVTLRKSDCKEVRFSAKTELKDLQNKAEAVKRLMERGFRVKCMAIGTEDQDLGGLLSRLSAMIEDVSFVESGPRVEKRQAYVILRHVKFGPSKKGGKKASRDIDTTSSDIQNATTSGPALGPSVQGPVYCEGTYSEDSAFKNDDEMPYTESDMRTAASPAQNQSNWSIFDANNDIDEVFDLSDGINEARRSADGQIKANSEATFSLGNVNVSEFSPPGMSNFRGSNATSSSENRYKQRVTREHRVSVGPVRFPNHGGLPRPQLNPPPLAEETKRVAADASESRNSKLPEYEIHRREILRRGGELESSHGSISLPAGGYQTPPKQEPPSTGGCQSAPLSSYGIFSSPKSSAPQKQGLGAEIDNSGQSYDFATKSAVGTASAKSKSPASRSDGREKPGVNGFSQWGRVSRESSNSITAKISESQANVQQ